MATFRKIDSLLLYLVFSPLPFSTLLSLCGFSLPLLHVSLYTSSSLSSPASLCPQLALYSSLLTSIGQWFVGKKLHIVTQTLLFIIFKPVCPKLSYHDSVTAKLTIAIQVKTSTKVNILDF